MTVRRYETLVRLNPGVPIVTTTYGSADVLPGTRDVASIPHWAGLDGWANGDLCLYTWFRRWRTPETTAERYIYVEYDMLYRVPMADFYREVWDADVAGAQLFLVGRHRNWRFFKQAWPYLSPEQRRHAAGISPLAGTMIAHRALEKICEGRIPQGVFCEVRLPTLAFAAGFDVEELPYPKKRNITWRQDLVRFDKQTDAYHPVKDLIDKDDLL